jgi:hypothetical protein
MSVYGLWWQQHTTNSDDHETLYCTVALHYLTLWPHYLYSAWQHGKNMQPTMSSAKTSNHDHAWDYIHLLEPACCKKQKLPYFLFTCRAVRARAAIVNERSLKRVFPLWIFSIVMTSPGPAFQEYTGSCHPKGDIIQSVIDRRSDCFWTGQR